MSIISYFDKIRTFGDVLLETYILTYPLNPKDPCTNNGCMKHMDRVKKMVTWAHEMCFVDKNVFANFEVKKKRYEAFRFPVGKAIM